MSETIEIAGHVLVVEEFPADQIQVHSKYFGGSGFADYKDFLNNGGFTTVVADPYNVLSIDGEDIDVGYFQWDDRSKAIFDEIESNLPGDLQYADICNDGPVGACGNISLTSREMPSIEFDHTRGELMTVCDVSPNGDIGNQVSYDSLREELVAELEQMQDHERAGKILDLLKYSVDPEDLPEFAVSRDRTKVFSGEVAISVDREVLVAVVVSPNGRFVELNDDEAQGLNDDDEVELSRKNINEDFTVTVLDKDREQELGR